jgi:2-dehydro-3-deoxy-phosphogluconate/2-dehydro-3-deoxy-6-phosphogalactonate aldolase
MQKVIAPILSAFTKEGTTDTRRLREHAERLFELGVDALFLNGTTGMGPALSKDEKLATLRTLSDITDRLIFQVGELNLENVLELVRMSKDYSILGVASYPPYYFPGLPENWVVRYFAEICRTSDHPVYLYNYPLATGVNITSELIKKVGGQNIKGIKDTTADITHPLELKFNMPSLEVYTGGDRIAAVSFASQLDGVVCASANYIPHLLVKMREATERCDLRHAHELQSVIARVVNAAAKYGSLSANYSLVRLILGHDPGLPRRPVYPLGRAEEEALWKEVEPVLAPYL